MNGLLVKDVEFEGATLLACESSDDKKVYVAVKWISQGIGLTEGQQKSERKRVQEDLVLSKGGRNFVLPTNGGTQEVLCIDIEFLPLWLAKISLTPSMQKNQPELVDKLIEYQLKAKDVLANAFIHKVPQMAWEDMMIQHLMQMKEVRIKQEEHENEIKHLQSQQKTQEDKIVQMLDYTTAVPDFKVVENAINKFARLSGMSQAEVRASVYKKVSAIHGIDFNKRVKNKHDALQLERTRSGKNPYKPSTLNQKYNKMDVIKEEKLEKEVIQILMEMTNSLDKKFESKATKESFGHKEVKRDKVFNEEEEKKWFG